MDSHVACRLTASCCEQKTTMARHKFVQLHPTVIEDALREIISKAHKLRCHEQRVIDAENAVKGSFSLHPKEQHRLREYLHHRRNHLESRSRFFASKLRHGCLRRPTQFLQLVHNLAIPLPTVTMCRAAWIAANNGKAVKLMTAAAYRKIQERAGRGGLVRLWGISEGFGYVRNQIWTGSSLCNARDYAQGVQNLVDWDEYSDWCTLNNYEPGSDCGWEQFCAVKLHFHAGESLVLASFGLLWPPVEMTQIWAIREILLP